MQRIDISEYYVHARKFGLRITILPDHVDPAYIDEIVDIDWDDNGDPHDVWPLLARVLPKREAYYADMVHVWGQAATDDVFAGIADYVSHADAFDAFEDGEGDRKDVFDAALHLAECMFHECDIQPEDYEE